MTNAPSRSGRAWLALPLLVLLAGCASQVQLPQEGRLSTAKPADWSVKQQQLASFDHWELQGKVAVSQPEHNDTGVINAWRQTGDTYHLQLSSSFLGMGSTTLNGAPGFITLTTSNGKRFSSNQPEELLLQETGWRLPVSQLSYWIRGIPAPDGSPKLYFSPQGQLRLLTQDGWRIHYQRERTWITGLPPLPALLTAEKGQVRVRVAVTAWHPLNNP
ncbi:lipoprotein insertase outer membrane protein LolB [Mangrovitalea sediminis]|uniref:lipoprotein insertase outer membrane protein LolB n=1 Tax=Mangrovitalea sediminis TaxID=1982043 RepID=UPI000BE5B9C0|nr:lipoprotein insertase outer membrane protein LolB [Mangrovitalea sediminis]